MSDMAMTDWSMRADELSADEMLLLISMLVEKFKKRFSAEKKAEKKNFVDEMFEIADKTLLCTNLKESGQEMNFTGTKIFFDTNVLAYMFDSCDFRKQEKARTLFREYAGKRNCWISTQVLQELFNVLTRKLKYTKEEAQKIVTNMMNLNVRQASTADIKEAMRISIQTQFTIYDSLILAAAKTENCDVVYSEDLNDGQIVDGVKIENPCKYVAFATRFSKTAHFW